MSLLLRSLERAAEAPEADPRLGKFSVISPADDGRLRIVWLPEPGRAIRHERRDVSDVVEGSGSSCRNLVAETMIPHPRAW